MKRTKGILAVFPLLGTWLLLAGCSAVKTPSLVRNYYTLDYEPRTPAVAQSLRPYAAALQVGRFRVDRATNRMNIVYRYSPHQLQYYERERWAVRPDDMIREMVFKHLTEAGLFQQIELDYFDTRPDYRIEGTVDALERYDAGDLFYGHMAMTLRLFAVESGEELWTYSFDQRRRVHSREMVNTVQALSDILQSQMNVIVGQIDALFLARSHGEVLNAEEMPASEPSAEEEARPPAEAETDLDEGEFEIIRDR